MESTPTTERLSHTRSTVHALVLGAGLGTRLGGPKALLQWHDQPLALAHATAYNALGITTTLVVRERVARILRTIGRPGARILVSSSCESLGAAGSLASALRAGFPPSTEWLCVTPVDVSPEAANAVEHLLSRRSGPYDAIRVTHEARGGHPVLLRLGPLMSTFTQRLVPTLREYLAGLGRRCLSIEVTEASVIANMNTIDRVVQRLGNQPTFVSTLAGTKG